MNWNDLTPAEQCVMNNAIDEGDLSSLLYLWGFSEDPNERDQAISTLSKAVISLARSGLIDALVAVDEISYRSYSEEELNVLIASPKSWWSPDGELDNVVWLAITDLGGEVVRTASAEQFNSFRGRSK